jgi:hypothetical protein
LVTAIVRPADFNTSSKLCWLAAGVTGIDAGADTGAYIGAGVTATGVGTNTGAGVGAASTVDDSALAL